MNTSSFYSRSEILKRFFDGSFLTAKDFQRTIIAMLALDEIDTVSEEGFDPKASTLKKEVLSRFVEGNTPTVVDYSAWIDSMLNLKDDFKQVGENIETKAELKQRFSVGSFLKVEDYVVFINSMLNWTDDKAILAKHLSML